MMTTMMKHLIVQSSQCCC